jgi:hypothetical protein
LQWRSFKEGLRARQSTFYTLFTPPFIIVLPSISRSEARSSKEVIAKPHITGEVQEKMQAAMQQWDGESDDEGQCDQQGGEGNEDDTEPVVPT